MGLLANGRYLAVFDLLAVSSVCYSGTTPQGLIYRVWGPNYKPNGGYDQLVPAEDWMSRLICRAPIIGASWERQGDPFRFTTDDVSKPAQIKGYKIC